MTGAVSLLSNVTLAATVKIQAATLLGCIHSLILSPVRFSTPFFSEPLSVASCMPHFQFYPVSSAFHHTPTLML